MRAEYYLAFSSLVQVGSAEARMYPPTTQTSELAGYSRMMVTTRMKT